MPKKKIAFVSPVGNGGPSELYKQLVPLLNEMYWDFFECTLINTTSRWIGLHFNRERYDIIVSVLPFLWKPPHCQFVLNIHGDYRMDQGLSSPWSLLAHLYPYSVHFANQLIFPSRYLKENLWLNHRNQDIIGNICPFPIRQDTKSWEDGKSEFHCITTTNWNNQHKARAILELAAVLARGDFDWKKIFWSIIGWWSEKYETSLWKILEKNPNIRADLLGYRQNQEVLSLLQKGDIFLYATHAESFGIAILEAASQGLPLVLVDYPAFHGLWDEESIYRKEGINKEIKQLTTITDYYIHRSKNSLEMANNFGQKDILEKWHNTLA